MTTLTTHRETPAIPLPPTPRSGPIDVRPATAADLPFIDSLQKMHTHMVGWMSTKAFEGHLAAGAILLATAADPPNAPLGYCLSKDQYLKRDDVGIIYQLNVLPLKQRGLIGASLIKAVFERAAYGCKLYCCWCAQDIQANWFWESIGFVPLAFRTGSRAKQRIHIFWQKRIREGDTITPYWFPSQTSGGAVSEDRIVLPIPPGTHWRDAKPLVLPGVTVEPAQPPQPLTLPGGAPVRPRPANTLAAATPTPRQRASIACRASRHLAGVPEGKIAVLCGGRRRLMDDPNYIPPVGENGLSVAPKPRRAPKPRAKNDPKFVAAARELRDRFLEQVNTDRMLPATNGKYDVSRRLAAASTDLKQTPAPRLLSAA